MIYPFQGFDSYEQYEQFFYDDDARREAEIFHNSFTNKLDEAGMDIEESIPPAKLKQLYDNNINPQWVLRSEELIANILFSEIVVAVVNGKPIPLRIQLPFENVLQMEVAAPSIIRDEEGRLKKLSNYPRVNELPSQILHLFLEKCLLVEGAVLHSDFSDVFLTLDKVESTSLMDVLFESHILQLEDEEIAKLFDYQYKRMEYNHDIFNPSRMEKLTPLLQKELHSTNFYQTLPDEVVIYRGQSSASTDVLSGGGALSWTISLSTAEFFAGRFQKDGQLGHVLRLTVPKEFLIHAFLDDGGELAAEDEVLFAIYQHPEFLDKVETL